MTGLAVFVIVAFVQSGLTDWIDTAGSLMLNAQRAPAWVVETARDVTALGSNGVLGLFVVVLAANASIARRKYEATLLIGVFAGGLVLVGIVKAVVDRPRPGLLEPAVRVFTSSFPSSHATLSAAMATLIVLLLRANESRSANTRFYIGTAMLVCAVIGLSRVALGVHWPTDVLAGWALGPWWAAVCWLLASRVTQTFRSM